MKHLRLIPFVLILSLLCSFVIAAYPAPDFGAQDVADKWADGKILSIAHRAAYRSAPENSLLAIEAAITMGIDMLELDIKQTSDGVIVISHDKTIDRVTMGSGTISAMTWSKIKSYALEPELGNVGSAYKLTAADANFLNRMATYKQYIGTATSGGTLPMARLEQVIELVGKRCMLSLDYAMDTEASFAACYVLFREAGLLDHVLFKDSMSISALNGMYAAAATEWNKSHTPAITAKDVQASIMYLHIRGSSGSTSDLQNLLNNGDNVVMTEVSIGKTADETGVKNTVEPWCISKGIALEAYTQVGYFGARTDNEICWADAINRGYTAIQTDRPSELACYLNAINHDRYAMTTIQAEHFNAYSGTFTVPDAANSSLNKTVQSMQNGSQLRFDNIVFTGKENQIRFVATGGSKAATVKIAIDSASNQVASFSVAASAASKTYAVNLSKAISAGKHKVYVTVSGTASTALLTADRFAFAQQGEQVFFNFDNSTAAKERYTSDSVYGGCNFDVATAWWSNSATKTVTTTNGGYLTIGTNANADRNYCSIYPAGKDSNRSNYPLSFTPSKTDIVQLRFRINEGCVLETTDMRVSMQYRLSSASADSDKNFQTVKATKLGQFYTLTYSAPAEWGTTTDKVTGIWFTFHNIKGTGTVDVDYVYAGPAADAPVDDRLLFNFTNRAEDRFRYSTMLYGNYAYDSSVAAWWSNSAEKSMDTSGNGHFTIGANANPDRTYCTIYPAGANSDRNIYPLQFRPTGSEVIKIRFKLSKECKLSSSIGVAMQYRLSTATADSAQTKLSVSKPAADTYYTLTFTTPDEWKNTTADVTAVWFTFSPVSGMGANVDIDYIYVGPNTCINGDHTVVTDKAVAATCTTAGKTAGSHCSVCNTVIKAQTTVAATGHSYTYKATKNPTTSATGTLTGTCSKCSGTTTVSLPKLNTTDYTKTVTKAATCTATGTDSYKWKTTTYGSFTFTATTAALGHSYTAKVTAPTCTAQGYTTHTCSRCSDSYKDTYTNATGHSYTYKATKNPTTSATGTLTGTCSKCSGTTTVSLPKLNTTDYTKTVTKAATCTATGTDSYKWKTTTYGSFTFTATTAALGHSYTTKVTAPTCTAQGYTTHTCSRCSDSYKDTYTNATGHSYTSKVTTSATCTKEGVKTFTCSKCSHSYTEAISATGHTEVVDKAVAATCTTDGKTEGSHCSVCNAVIKAQETVPATGHSYTSKVTTAATCTKAGVKTFTCSKCNHSYTEAIAATGHTSVTDKAVAATCTTAGKTEGSHCSVCNAVIKAQETVPATGHSYTSKVTTAATCTKAGVKTFTCSKCNHSYTEAIAATGHTPVTDKAVAATCTAAGKTEGSHCSVCNAVIKAQTTVPATGHSYTSKVTTAATCTKAGVKTFTCSKCNHSYTEAIAATGHTPVTDKAVAATCTTAGKTEGSHCSVCNAVIQAQETVPATGHSYTSKVTTAATCTTEGVKTYTCSKCSHSYTEAISATGHTPVTDKAVAATCTTAGKTEGSHCSVCNAVIQAQETVPATGHSYTSKVTTAATCTKEGVKTFTCSKCSHSYTEAIAATGHTPVTDKAVAATCTTAGKTEGSHCSVCNAVIKAQTTIPATGHSYTSKVTTAATCTKAGVKTFTCSKCNHSYTEAIAATGHTSVTDKAVAATCTTAGKTEGSHCSVCNAVIKAQTAIPATGHSYSSKVTTTATCTKAGVKTFTCSKCNHSYTEAIAATGHAPVTDKAIAATCTTDGKTEGSHCSVCNAVIKAQTTIPATGHSYSSKVTTAATCTKDGVKTFTCSKCNHSYTEAIAATGHTPVTDKAVATTCTTDGKTEGSHCSVCNAVIKAQTTVPATGHDYKYTDNGDGTHTAVCARCEDRFTEQHKFDGETCFCGAKVLTLDENIKIYHTLDLASDISITFAVPQTALASYDSYYLEVVLPEYEGNVQTGTSTVQIQPVVNGKYYYFTLTGITAVRMGDLVDATLHMTRGTAQYISVVDTYSVATYAYGMLNSTTDSKMLTLCADLLRYGAEAQSFKGYRTNALVDAGMTDAHKSYLSNTETLTFTATDSYLGDLASPVLSWVGKTLDLGSKVGMKFVFNAKNYSGDIANLSMKVSYQGSNGETKTVTLTGAEVYSAANSYYSFTFYGLLASELRTVVDVTVFDGETQLTQTLRYSAESYASKNTTGALGNLCKALFAYSDSAKSYFTK